MLLGRVLQLGDKLIIRTELVDAADGSQLWGTQYGKTPADILVIQDAIAREISEALLLRLSGEEQKLLTKRYTENIQAYHLYLKGRYYWNKRTEDGFRNGIRCFQAAIDDDPNYALAYTGLADCYNMLGHWSILPPKETFAKAKAAAVMALDLDEKLAEAHASLAFANQMFDWDILGAQKEYRRAIVLNPGYAMARHWYSFCLASLGNLDEAIAENHRALELDPLSLIINSGVGFLLYLARQYDRAIEQCQKIVEMEPKFFWAHTLLGWAHEQRGELGEAITALEKARELENAQIVIGSQGHAYAVAGNKEKARSLIDELKGLSKQRYVSPYFIALIHAGLGEDDQAFAWLEKAYAGHAGYMSWLFKLDPKWDSLRSDSRFSNLVRCVGPAL